MYAGFPRSFEKHCVVIGPLDPNCFEGGYPSPRNPPDKLNDVLRDLTRLKKMTKKMKTMDAAAAVGVVGRGGGRRASRRKRHQFDQAGAEEEEEFGPRPFVPPPRPFAMDSPAYQARAWDMWEPGGGGSSTGLRGGFGNGLVGSRVGGKKKAGNSYVVLFDYGSVIFIHFTKQQQEVRRKRGEAERASQSSKKWKKREGGGDRKRKNRYERAGEETRFFLAVAKVCLAWRSETIGRGRTGKGEQGVAIHAVSAIRLV